MFPDDVLIEAFDEVYIPRRGRPYDAGFDLVVRTVDPALGCSNDCFLIPPHTTVKLCCGFRMALPRNLFALVVPRSSWRRRGLLCLAVYDPGYLEPVEPFVTNLSSESLTVFSGERVLQMLLLPLERLELISVASLPSFLYDRGGGAGSTGR